MQRDGHPPAPTGAQLPPAILLQSDDWGLCAWSPDEEAWRENRQLVSSPTAADYCGSTLESPEEMRRLFALLAAHPGADGLPAVMQANYVLCAPDYERIRAENFRAWHGIELPAVPPRWARGDLIAAAHEGYRAGVWQPEYHGYTHGNTHRLLTLLQQRDPLAHHLFERECWPLHDEVCGAEYWQGVEPRHLARGLQLFERLFGFPARSFVPSCYITSPGLAGGLRRGGVRVPQAANRNGPPPDRRTALHTLRLRAEHAWHRRLARIPRDADFEPRGQSPHGTETPVWQATLARVEAAVARRGAAAISTHRLNYAHLDPTWVEASLAQLALLLKGIADRIPGAVYLTDWEYAQLVVTGASVEQRGPSLVFRNYTRQPCLVCVPPTSAPLESAALTDRGLTVVDARRGVVRVPPGCHQLASAVELPSRQAGTTAS